MRIENLEKLFVDQLKDVYDAEHQLVDALGKMEEGASSPQLKRAFAEHRKQTQRQVQRLEQVFAGLGEKPERKTCKGMKGLVGEGEEILEAKGDEAAIDAGLIGAAQKVEHYEMATYGTLRTFARQLGRSQEARLLQQILDEESQANEKLTALATSGINQQAETTSGKRSTRASSRDGVTRASTTASARKSASSSRSTSTTSRSAKNGPAQTKQELMERARDLGIEGRSQMNKAQLAREVQKQRH
jgi:ferritin-like metal-binding protein YciE